MRTSGRGYRWFAAGAGAWFVGWSAQGVMLSWLVVDTLGGSAGLLGTVQTALVLAGPTIALFGGAIAERADRRRMLVVTHVGMVVLSLLLASLAEGRQLSAILLIGYALGAGLLHGVALPTRSAFLGDVGGSDLLRAVTLLTIVQSSAQVLGPMAASSAAWLGIVPALVGQAVVFLVGALAIARTSPRPALRPVESRALLADVWEGIRATTASRALRPVVLASAVHAFGYVGPLYVLVPILTLETYGAGVGRLGVVAAMFPAGIVIGSLLSLGRRTLMRDRPRVMLLGLGATGVTIAALGVGLPFWIFVVVVLAWGMAASVFFNTSRTLVQETASSDLRARALAVQTSGPMIAGPMSTFTAGVLAHAIGVFGACACFGAVLLTAALLGAGGRARR